MKFPLKNTPIAKLPMGGGIAQTPEDFLESLKNIRGWMLAESDWTQVVDCPLDEETKLDWRIWRQELRDITKLINVDNVQEWFEVSDPPLKGRPPTWNSWEYEQYNILYSIFEDVSKQTQDSITFQEQQNQQVNHSHTH